MSTARVGRILVRLRASGEFGWAEIFGDPVAAATTVDWPVHHAGVIALKGECQRLRGRHQEVLMSEKER
jgi:hypothetical protein